MCRNQSPEYFVFRALHDLYSAAATSKRDANSFQHLNRIGNTCSWIPQGVITDASHGKEMLVHFSWYSANYPEMGAANIAHEIGHVVSRWVQMHIYSVQADAKEGKVSALVHKASATSPSEDFFKRFQDSRLCVKMRNPFYSAAPTDDSQWLDEDWADHFASLVLNEMQRRNSPWTVVRNSGCMLINVKKGRFEDTSLYPVSSLIPHSPRILRLLFEGLDRGTLNEVCQPVMHSLWKDSYPPACGN